MKTYIYFGILIGMLLIITSCSSPGSGILEKSVDCGSDKSCMETNLKSCTKTDGLIQETTIEIAGMKTIKCGMGGMKGTCNVCEVTYTKASSEKTCLIPDLIYEQVPGKYSVFVGYELEGFGSQYCNDG